jgi:hypothetical protein
MITRIFISLLFFIVLGCAPLANKVENPKEICKSKLVERLKSSWSYNPVTNTYGEIERLLGIGGIEWYECLLKMSRKDLIEIFGIPNLNVNNALVYFYTQRDFANCELLNLCQNCMVIKLDANGMYAGMNFPYLSKD